MLSGEASFRFNCTTAAKAFNTIAAEQARQAGEKSPLLRLIYSIFGDARLRLAIEAMASASSVVLQALLFRQGSGEGPVGRGDTMSLSRLTAADPRHMHMVIDDRHLERMTLGDTSLEREVLEIFARQVVLLLPRVAGGEPAVAAAAAHTLKGSARGIGAWRVADAAERVEEAAAKGTGAAAFRACVAELDAAGREACAAIGARLGVSSAVN